MPVVVGFILGVIVTIFAAYAYDAATGNIGNGMSPSNQAPMVNWNVVDNDWQIFETKLRGIADNIERAIKQHNG